MLDDRVLAVMRRLEEEDRLEREQGLPSAVRARAVPATTGRFLFALVAHHPGCDVLELGGSRGYSTLWFGAGVRYLGGRVVSLENDPAKCEARRRNIAEAGLDEWVELVDGDKLRLEQAPGNLVDNALRHGAGTVSIAATRLDGVVELHVRDEGSGFPEAFLPRAFERLSRAAEGRSGNGAGLGLSIVGVIAAAHAGRAEARNRTPVGADVWISVPTR